MINSRRRVLITGNDGDSDAGFVLDALAEHGFVPTYEVRDTAERWGSPDELLDGVELVLPLGSDWSVYADHVADQVAAECGLLTAAHHRAIPILGICFGGQLLAHALGGSVGPIDRPEIGWCEVHSDDESLVPSGPWAQWHLDGFVVPPGALELARSPSGPQAFLIGRTLGLQFHPEVDESIMLRWAAGDESAEQMARVGIDLDTLAEQCREHAATNPTRTRALVSAFLRRFGLADA